MIEPPTPHDEAIRLARLFEYCVLDTQPERKFDELTELVAKILDVPIALVSLVDEKRQWFKSHYGLDATETPRAYAFCGHAILNDGLFIVEDSHQDQRFQDNPLVTGDPHVRFYAGMPLITDDGYKIGTVCGIDNKPRQLSAEQKRILEILSSQVMDQLELRKSVAMQEDLFRQQNLLLLRLEAANQEIRDFVSVVAHDLRAPILNVSGFAAELIAATDDLEKLLEHADKEISNELRKKIIDIIDGDLRESAQFVKNSAMQMDERVSAVAAVSKHGRRELTNEQIDLNQLIAEICAEHKAELKRINGSINMDKLPEIEIDKMSVLLVAENVIANAVKFHDDKRPFKLRVWADVEHGGIVLHFEDNGRGIHEDDLSRVFVMFRRVGAQNTSGDGTGLAFSRTILNRLGGRIWCESVVDEGTTFHVFLPTVRELVSSPAAIG